MKEIKKIVDTYKGLEAHALPAALATVVKVTGSSYRRAGARMLITNDGRWVGAISGGCLEGDALRKARTVMMEKKPSVVVYDTMEDNDASGLGVGLGCNGIIHVLIEPIDDQDQQSPIRFLEKVQESDGKMFMATVFGKIQNQDLLGGRILGDGNEVKESTLTNDNLMRSIMDDVPEVFAMGKTEVKTFRIPEGEVEVCMEVIHPQPRLIIFGGGYDVIPLTEQARQLGWHITVTDDCIAHMAPARFPAVDKLLHAAREEVVDKVPIDDYSAAVLMSHNYHYDLAVLKRLINTEISYIGILGPRKRGEKMLDELSEQGMNIEKARGKIFNPVGLDLGAETPDEIALSVVSEIMAFFTGRKGQSLKYREDFIHPRPYNFEKKPAL